MQGSRGPSSFSPLTGSEDGGVGSRGSGVPRGSSRKTKRLLALKGGRGAQGRLRARTVGLLRRESRWEAQRSREGRGDVAGSVVGVPGSPGDGDASGAQGSGGVAGVGRGGSGQRGRLRLSGPDAHTAPARRSEGVRLPGEARLPLSVAVRPHGQVLGQPRTREPTLQPWGPRGRVRRGGVEAFGDLMSGKSVRSGSGSDRLRAAVRIKYFPVEQAGGSPGSRTRHVGFGAGDWLLLSSILFPASVLL